MNRIMFTASINHLPVCGLNHDTPLITYEVYMYVNVCVCLWITRMPATNVIFITSPLIVGRMVRITYQVRKRLVTAT